MSKKLIFHLGHSAGFYSEFNNMVLAILYCRLHNIEFRLYSADANFSSGKGWEEFFQPFCKETKCPIHHYINERYSEPTSAKKRILLKLFKLTHPNTFLTFELWDNIRHIDKDLPLKDIQQECSQIIKQIYIFNIATESIIDQKIKELQLPSKYIGFYIRRGDKVIEHESIGIVAYVEKACSLTDCRNAFIATDDYSTIEEFNIKNPKWTTQTLTSETERGYVHTEYLSSSANQKHQRLVNLFAQREILNSGCFSVSTFSTNPGMFLGMRSPEKVYAVDFDNWTIW